MGELLCIEHTNDVVLYDVIRMMELKKSAV